MARLSLIQVPYDYGFSQARVGAGRGPQRYVEAGAPRALQDLGFEVVVHSVELHRETKGIPAAVAEGNALLAAQVKQAEASGSFPLVISGGCNACLGVLGGLAARVGIIWFDAHGDFNTPETTPSGFFDGMPLAVATGLCFREVWDTITSAPPVPPSQVLLVGVRNLDASEWENIVRHAILTVFAAEIKDKGTAALSEKLERLRSRVEEIYLHFDIDALDPAWAPGVDYCVPGGLALEEAEAAIHLIATRFRVRAASLTAYNPDHEVDDRTLQSGLRLLSLLAAASRPVTM